MGWTKQPSKRVLEPWKCPYFNIYPSGRRIRGCVLNKGHKGNHKEAKDVPGIGAGRIL